MKLFAPPLLSRLLLGAFAVWLAGATPAWSGEQADRAIEQLKQLVAAGTVRPDGVLRLRIKKGNMASFLGRDNELQKEWESRSGIRLDVSAMPQMDSLEFIRRSTDVDLTIARNHEYPDLFAENLIEDLTPLLQRFGFTLDDKPPAGFVLPRLQAYFGERIVAIPADNDIAVLYLRQDLLEDADNRKRFRERYQRDLKPPATWRDYQELIEFFHRPQDNFFGALEVREKLTGWFYWLPRYASQANPAQYLFDERMRPLIDSPAGVAATESYVATVPFSPPEILGEGRDYSYTMPALLKGDGFATIITLAAAKIANRAGTPVRGKLAAYPMPGTRIGQQLVRRTPYIYGNNMLVPRNAANKEVAVLFTMWLSDPDVSLRSVAVAGGFTDPYRFNHFADARVREIYTAQALDVVREQLPTAILSGTGIPGDAEYLATLNENLWLAARREISPKEAMARTARTWNAITDRLGRDRQIAHWRAARKNYPQ